MSGFEVAGVVLGVLPIVIKALSDYRAGKGLLATIGRSRGLVDDLLHRLKDHQRDFYLDILQLLREARVPEILAEGDPTPDRCVEILHAVQTGDEVKQYLGPHLFHEFLRILGYYDKNLGEITSKLGHIIRPQNAKSPKFRCYRFA